MPFLSTCQCVHPPPSLRTEATSATHRRVKCFPTAQWLSLSVMKALLSLGTTTTWSARMESGTVPCRPLVSAKVHQPFNPFQKCLCWVISSIWITSQFVTVFLYLQVVQDPPQCSTVHLIWRRLMGAGFLLAQFYNTAVTLVTCLLGGVFSPAPRLDSGPLSLPTVSAVMVKPY